MHRTTPVKFMHGDVQHHEWWQPVREIRGGGFATESHKTASPQAYKFSFWALICFTVILILSPQDHFPALKPLHLALVAAVIAIATYLYDRFHYGIMSEARNPEFKWAAILAFWAIVTVPFSLWPGGSVKEITDVFLKSLIIFFLLGQVVNTTARLKIVAWVLSISSVFLSLSAVKSFLSGGFQNEELSHGLDRIAGYQGALTSNPNDLAMILCLILSLTIGLVFCTRRSLALRITLIVAALLNVTAIMATYSRSGFLMLMTILLCYAIYLWRRGDRVMIIAFIVLVFMAIPVLPAGYTHRLDTIIHFNQDKTNSAQDRLLGMRLAAEYAIQHPVIGVGIGMSVLQLNKLDGDQWVRVHNVYLQYAVDLGWPGLILFLLLLYGSLRTCRRACLICANKPEQRDLYFMAQAVGISLIGYALGAMFYPNGYYFDFYYFAGLAVAVRIISSKEPLTNSGSVN